MIFINCQGKGVRLCRPLIGALYAMNLVPKVKFDDALGNTISLSVDEDLVDGDLIVRR